MKNLIAITFLVFINANVQSATLSIIDSGTDLEHEMLRDYAWVNPVDYTMNDRDEDKNGYPDDKNGWNFAEKNNLVFDPKYLGTFSDDVYKFFEIQQKAMLGEATKTEIDWMRGRLEDELFLKDLMVFGNFMHGTHVAGIASNGTKSRVIPMKIIPTEVGLPESDEENVGSNEEKPVKVERFSQITMALANAAMGKLAQENMKSLEEVAAYNHFHKVDVANGSFGTGLSQVINMVRVVSAAIFKKVPTDDQILDLSVNFLKSLVKNGQKMVAAAPNTLFVFAAGNDSMDNDVFPASPASIDASNVITVAATLSDNSLAKFSNYGQESVDVAAPGVAIKSASPGNRYIRVSGTSQAAPYVARIATLVKEANPKLLPREIKKIIMSTVDIRAYLHGKVKTGGIVNLQRAQRAGILSRKLPVEIAISESHKLVRDLGSRKDSFGKVDSNAEFVLPLPSMFKIN